MNFINNMTSYFYRDSQESSIIPQIKSSSLTKNNLICFVHEWTLSNFTKFEGKLQESLCSSSFPSKKGPYGFQWKMELVPVRKISTDEGISERIVPELDYFSLFLWCLDTCKLSSVVSGCFYLIDNSGKRINIRHLANFKYDVFDHYGFRKFITKERLDAILDKVVDRTDQLTIGCELFASLDSTVAEDAIFRQKEQDLIVRDPEVSLSKDFKKLLRDQEFSDVTISVAHDVEFPAHKNILAARSPVFASMFELTGNQHIGLEFPHLDSDVMTEFLSFLYCNECPNLRFCAPDLLALAKQYEVESLKGSAENELIKSLTLDNAGHLLELAHLHSSDRLKNAAFKLLANRGDLNGFFSRITSMLEKCYFSRIATKWS